MLTQQSDTLKIINLADASHYTISHGVDVHGAPATGMNLHTNGRMGADLLRVPPHNAFPVHTHPGDHLLLCLEGTGTITVGKITYNVIPGDLYMVPGLVPHAVGAGDRWHVLVAIGSPHKPIDSPERMALADWDGNPMLYPMYAGEPDPGPTRAAA